MTGNWVIIKFGIDGLEPGQTVTSSTGGSGRLNRCSEFYNIKFVRVGRRVARTWPWALVGMQNVNAGTCTSTSRTASSRMRCVKIDQTTSLCASRTGRRCRRRCRRLGVTLWSCTGWLLAPEATGCGGLVGLGAASPRSCGGCTHNYHDTPHSLFVIAGRPDLLLMYLVPVAHVRNTRGGAAACLGRHSIGI